MQYCGFKILDKMQYLYEIRLNKIIRDLGETDHSIGYIFDVHGCTNHKHVRFVNDELQKGSKNLASS